MAIRRRESKEGPRFDVEWRLPNRTKRSKTFKSGREARVFEASLVTKFAAGDIVDPRAGQITLAAVYRSWLSSRLDLSPKVRRRYEDNWRNRTPIRRMARRTHRPSIDPGMGQRDGRIQFESPHGPLDPLRPEDVTGLRDGRRAAAVRNPAGRTKFPPPRHTSHTYLTTAEVAALAQACGAQGDVVALLGLYRSEFGELVGLRVEDVDLDARRLRVRRSTRWRQAIVEIGRPTMRVHDLRHTYASLARRAGADLRLLQKTLGHASITVTAHIYADLYDDELDDVASALDRLDDARKDPSVNARPYRRTVWPGYWPDDFRHRVGGSVRKHTLNWAFKGGPGWYRTSDLPRVRRTLSH
ncbi:MAG: hypothetical protein QOE04_5503 [Mycobacterium sp.]|jgi:integrase|nr:hypothetical protein [Mycobacterium sp.]MDT5391862.1 hypothetical protein [Mycobacterium sp.]